MKQTRTTLAAGLVTAVSLLGAATSHAIAAGAIFTETTDAGQTLPTADSTATGVAGVPLGEIFGTLSSASDADLYAIDITDPGTFSASTVNVVSSNLDTAIFLFSASGQAIATNDDAPGGMSVDSDLPAGNALYANLPVGTYLLGISSSGNEPVNSVSQLLFNGYPGGDTTAIRGAAGGLNPTTEANFNSNEFDTGTSGAYEIDLTGSATAFVPEPSSWATVALGGVAAAFACLRRRRSAV